jgi:riboflavin kinase / FMN adenylyltransferase
MTCRIFHSLQEAVGRFGPCALSIGNFDGVHVAHRRILRRVVETARARKLKPSALTFDPHPTRVVAPERAPRLMTTPEQRCEFMADEGIEQVLVLPFTRELALLTPDTFARKVLTEALQAKAVLVGHNFRFGYRQAGDVATLRTLGERYGFTTEVVPAVEFRGVSVSSTSVRRMIESGKVSCAFRLLERPHSLLGRVITGRGVGSKQTVPTLNLDTRCEVLPAPGVYITCTQDLEDGREWRSITNVGYRPTFDGAGLTIETFLLDEFDGNTPRRIRVDFLRHVREERRFESPEALKSQILRDVGRAHSFFRHAGRVSRGAGNPCRREQLAESGALTSDTYQFPAKERP